MNRIYQGRVSRVEIPNPEPVPDQPWLAVPGGDELLWRHHALFQDAVNYYLVALLALAAPTNKALGQLRQRIAQPGDEFQIWGSFRRCGANRRGLRESAAPYLTPGNDAPSLEEAFAAVLGDNASDASVRDAAVSALLEVCDGAGAIQQQGRGYWPKFCDPNTTANFAGDPQMLRRTRHQDLLPRILHDPSTRFDTPTLDEFDVYSIATPNAKHPLLVGKKAQARLNQAIELWRQRRPEAAEQFDRLAEFVAKLPSAQGLQGYVGSSVKGEVKARLFAFLLFKHVERSPFTFDLLRTSVPPPRDIGQKSDAPDSSSDVAAADPIRLARGDRGYVFRAFTSLPCWNPADTPEPQWKEFDIAAFKYALTALNQIEEKKKERDDKRAGLLDQLEYQRQCTFRRIASADGTESIDFDHTKALPKTKRWRAPTGSEESRPAPVLVGDPRVARLEALLSKGRASGGLAEEYEMAEGGSVEYGLQQRTIRGFRDVRKMWNSALEPDEQYSPGGRERLWNLLTKYKKENAHTMGSPVLFDAMVEESNWIIWREATKEQTDAWRKAAKLPDDAEFSSDPLQTLTDERELVGEIQRLDEPIRFTPADPVHSRRQFYFSDVTALGKKNRFRHDRQTVDVEIAVKNLAGQWQRTDVRLHFTAPRLLRDQLNSTGGKDASFQQAMMAALGLSAGLKTTEKGKVREATFAECAAVALMPELVPTGAQRELLEGLVATGPAEYPSQVTLVKKRLLLNFPIKLEDDAIARQLGKAARWDVMQFGGADGQSYWLRWPVTWHDENKERRKALPSPWWTEAKTFRCLSADLGQRDTAAFAIIEASPGQSPKPGLSRKLGEAGGLSWWATVRVTGILRLPGEDARVVRAGQWQEEFSGERGRLATADERQEAHDICTKLGLNADTILGADPLRHSFPELNDQLLYALRRTQGRLARLQSWSCIAHLETGVQRREAIAKQLKAAVEELQAAQDDSERDTLVAELRPFIEREEWSLISSRLIEEVERLRALLPRELERVADRIQPLRGRRWEWALRDGANFVLRQTERGTDDRTKRLAGQRGLSLERIEQLDSLRQRCQSLNRALRQTPGEPAKLGRSKRGIELPDPCPELLERLDALKEQRVNQTAHLLLAQALGVRLRPHQTDKSTRTAQDIHGEYERIPGREPVDFLVLENLDRYLASQGRSRGENSKLMKWCHRAILGKLKQLCEPYGLRVLETPAAYSSRFCSLTGVAGFRAVELTPEHAVDFRWKKHLDRLEAEARGERTLSTKEREESEQVRTLFGQLEQANRGVREANPERPKWRTLLAPVAGGPIFIPASPTETYERPNRKTGMREPAIRFEEIAGSRPTIIQSDINAAINLGLRALAAPDAAGIHLRIRAIRDGESFVVRADNVREKARWGTKPPQVHVSEDWDREKLLSETRLNFFADLGGVAEYDRATIDGRAGFASGRGIWGTIKGGDKHVGKDWLRCQEINSVRIAKWESAHPILGQTRAIASP